MAKIIGGRINVGIAAEDSRGVGKVPTFWLPWVNFGFDDKVKTIISEEAIGNIDDAHQVFIGEKWADGDFDGEIRDKSFGLLLYALLGTKAVVANGAGYTHTFTLAQTNQHQSLCLAVDDPNGDYLFELVMIDNLEISTEPGQFAKYKVSFISKPSADYAIAPGINGAPTLASTASENKFFGNDVTFKLAATRADLAAASQIKLQGLKITIAKNLLRKHVLGSMTPDDLINQAIGIEGEFTLPYNDTTYKDYMLDNTYRAMSIDFTNQNVDLGGGLRPQLTIILPRVGFHDWKPKRGKGELYDETISFKAYRDITNNEDLVYSIALINAVASY